MPDIDHRFMKPPFLRLTHQYSSNLGSHICVWDLRLVQPNVSHVSMKTIHSFEHFLGCYLRSNCKHVLNVAPMGCQTGFYIVTVDLDEPKVIQQHLVETFEQIGKATEVPLANNQQCGWAENHSLVGAQELAAWLLRRSQEW